EVERQLALVSCIGANTSNKRLSITSSLALGVIKKMIDLGLDPVLPWLVLNPGVSEEKRQYPLDKFEEAGHAIIDRLGFQIVISGDKNEKELGDFLQKKLGGKSI